MAEFAAQQLIFFLQAALLHGVANEHDNFFERERLLDEIECAQLGGAHGGFDRAVAGDHDDGGRTRLRLQAAERFEAVDAGQPDVEQDHFDVAVRRAFERFFCGAGGVYGVAFVFKNR